MTDKDLLTQATRQLAMDGIMISRPLQTQAGALIPAKVGEVARIVRALTAALKAVAEAAADRQAGRRSVSTPED